MNISHHVLSRELFDALAQGQGGTEAVAELAAAQYSKHLILLRAVHASARPDDRLAVRGYELLTEVQRHNPAAAESVIRYPSVGAWALRTLRGDRTVPGAEPGRLSALAAAAAIRAGLSAEIEVPVTGGHIVLPSLGAAEAEGETAVVRTSPAEIGSGGRRIRVGSRMPGWRGLRRARAGSLNVLIDDLDPFRMPTAERLATLGAAEADEWESMLNEAWTVLDPADCAEIAAAVSVIVPYAAPNAGHVSSSAPENFGALAMSRQPDRYTCAATLVHEVQHLKLSALLDLVTLTMPDDGRGYYAPWRTDPRPISSLVQGAYAFFGVSRFWRRQRLVSDGAGRERADIEFARWRDGAARVVLTLQSSGRLTPVGQDFVGQMARLLRAWQSESVPAEAMAVARREAELHLARWRSDNDALPM